MIALLYSNAAQRGDLVRTDEGQFDDRGQDLETAVSISLFTERRAQPGDDVDPGSRSGWWGDALTFDPLGSRLWELKRSKATTEALAQAKRFAAESLTWLTRDGVAKSVTVRTYRGQAGVDYLGIGIDVERPDGTRWRGAWERRFDGI